MYVLITSLIDERITFKPFRKSWARASTIPFAICLPIDSRSVRPVPRVKDLLVLWLKSWNDPASHLIFYHTILRENEAPKAVIRVVSKLKLPMLKRWG